MTNRLFISLDLPEENIDKLIILSNDIYGEQNNLKWEKKEKLHVTLKFLGDVGENLSDLLIRRMESIEFESIEAKFEKFSFFKQRGKLKIMFASIAENQKINELQKLIEDECRLLGFEQEIRKFHPHITLLRLKGKEDLNKLIKFNNHVIDDSGFTVNSFSIVKSILKPTGSEYVKVKSFKLH